MTPIQDGEINRLGFFRDMTAGACEDREKELR